jgi:hypothetical protein
MGAVMQDRLARLIDFQRELLTVEGRSRFLNELMETGDLDEACVRRDLPKTQVKAWLAAHADIDDAVDRVLKRYSHQIVAETLEIADESGDAKLRVKARMDVAGMWNKPAYGPTMKVEHNVTVGISDALRQISERRRSKPTDLESVEDAEIISGDVL